MNFSEIRAKYPDCFECDYFRVCDAWFPGGSWPYRGGKYPCKIDPPFPSDFAERCKTCGCDCGIEDRIKCIG